MNKIVILGAGLSGLSTAYHLGKARLGEYEIYEKEDRPGGLCRSEQANGFTFDYTGHLFHFRTGYVKDLVNKLLRGKLKKHRRTSWIYSQNTYTRYPFQANTFGLPREVIEECLFGFMEARIHRPSSIVLRPSFYDWIVQNFGKGIARHFMVPYNRKLWTCHPRRLTCDWLSDFVPRASLPEVIRGAFTDQKKKFGYNAHFYYPEKGGIEVLVKALVSKIKPVHLRRKATKIFWRKREVEFNHEKKCEFNHLVSTVPLPEIVNLLDPLPPQIKAAGERLKSNSVLNINLGVDRKIPAKHWIYFPEKEFIFYRVGFASNFSSHTFPPDTTSIYTEIPYRKNQKSKIKNQKSKIVGRVINDLRKARILRKNDKIVATKVLDLPYAYIIYDFQRQKNLKIIQDFLSQNHIYSIGRYGGWKYATMEDAILEGKQTAEKLITAD